MSKVNRIFERFKFSVRFKYEDLFKEASRIL